MCEYVESIWTESDYVKLYLIVSNSPWLTPTISNYVQPSRTMSNYD